MCENDEMNERNKKIKKEIIKLISEASESANKIINDKQIKICFQGPNHTPPRLIEGKMAVYLFVYQTGDKNVFFKIGQSGAKSGSGFSSQYYNPESSNSNLANSILNYPPNGVIVDEETVGQWIKDNCVRYNIFIDNKLGKITLNFIEGLLQYKYEPIYEGKYNDVKNITPS